MVLNFLKKNKVGATVAGIFFLVGYFLMGGRTSATVLLFSFLGFTGSIGIVSVLFDFVTTLFIGATIEHFMRKQK